VSESKSRTGHTPGPWRADCRTGCVAIYTGDPRTCLSAASRWAIHFQEGRGEPGPGGEYQRTTAEQEANASLMAAAPELLEALRLLLEHSERMNSPSDELWHAHRDIARDAIARAEGRDPPEAP
jgi:hypothetical protein